MKNNNAVIILSGGLDSTILLHYITVKLNYNHISAITFNYGQKHFKEIDMAKWQADHVDSVKEHQTIDISFFSDLLKGTSTLLQSGKNVPDFNELTDEQRQQPPTYVPNRNMILLSFAAAFAESRNYETIFYGAQAHDQYGYWDCTEQFLYNINSILSLNRKINIKIEAPFINKSKKEEIIIGSELGVDFSKTWSCYKGLDKHCGKCPTCFERKKAFKNAGIKDPVEYMED